MSRINKKLVYYGPHECEKCKKNGIKNTNIVKAGNGAPDYLQFDFVQDSHYPNHTWKKHKCAIITK